MILTMMGNELIREARRRAGLTQAQLASALDTHQSVVARWETGRTHPDFETVVRAVRAAGFELGVSLLERQEDDRARIRRELKLQPHERMASVATAVRAIEGMVQTTHQSYTASMTHKVGAKGQVVIPKEMRDALGIKPGDEVEFALADDRLTMGPARPRRSLRGVLAGRKLVEELERDRAAEPQ